MMSFVMEVDVGEFDAGYDDDVIVPHNLRRENSLLNKMTMKTMKTNQMKKKQKQHYPRLKIGAEGMEG
jgi:hypothetical protein